VVSTLAVILCAVAAVVLWTPPGLAIMRRIVPSLAWPLAPALGFAVHGAATLPIYLLVGFSLPAVGTIAAVTLIASMTALAGPQRLGSDDGVRVPALAIVAAALVAVVPALSVLPKDVADGVVLAGPIFDHAKAAIIDEMARNGLPPTNPFFSEPSRLAYYYLWHFGAAELALPLHATGWEADAAMTWFAAFASLTLMMGLATWLSGRTSAAFLVPLLCLAASMRPCLHWLFGPRLLYTYILPPSGFAGWLFQSAWVPQHLTSASCVVLAVFLIVRLAIRPRPIVVATLALVVAAGFETSTWVGGVTFATAAPITGIVLLLGRGPRLRFLVGATVAAALALVLVAPLALDQYAATAARGGGPTLAVEPIGVFEDFVSEDFTAIIDLPGYWLLLLPIEFPAIYLTGLAALAQIVRLKIPDAPRQAAALAFACLIGVSLVMAWLIASTIGENDDLGWRAILPGAVGLTIFSAVGLSGWLASRRRLAVAAGLAAVLLGLPDGAWLTYQYAVGLPRPGRAAFAATPGMWEAVRRHSTPQDRIANNPLFLRDMTIWPVNISWALLANRRSCWAGKELALAFASLSDEQRDDVEAQFVRVFAGTGTPGDVQDLALRYDCRIAVVTRWDEAWTNDPFAASPLYRLVEADRDRWRIYQLR